MPIKANKGHGKPREIERVKRNKKFVGVPIKTQKADIASGTWRLTFQ
jgi:hypothetical protein